KTEEGYSCISYTETSENKSESKKSERQSPILHYQSGLNKQIFLNSPSIEKTEKAVVPAITATINTGNEFCEKTAEEIDYWLKSKVKGRRFEHSLGVAEKASQLSLKFNLTVKQHKQAVLAGFLHDCAKLLTPDALISSLKQYNLPINPADLASSQVLHAEVGAAQVRHELGVNDESILNAISWHTTGHPNMCQSDTLVEKVVFIADKIEERTRNTEFCNKINNHLDQWMHEPNITANNILAAGVMVLLEETVQYLQSRSLTVHSKSLMTLNALHDQLYWLNRHTCLQNNKEITI
ncbi:MAG: bis(5'-nucleosyl)-tetraphosphatase (symmetrical) YqeK, partial [Cyanobacteria bacterium P01_H01_bin.74]